MPGVVLFWKQVMDSQSITLPRPDEGITPTGFWNDWLPDVLKDFFEIIKANAGDLKMILSVRVTGDGGGDWSVIVAEGEVELKEGLIDDATLTLVLSAKDFHDAVVGKRDGLIPGQGGISDKMDPAEIGENIRKGVAILGKVNGSMLFIADHPENPFKCFLKFQGPLTDKPDTTVTIDQDYLIEMSKTGTNMVQAFMSGHIKIDGMMELIMSFMPLVT